MNEPESDGWWRCLCLIHYSLFTSSGKFGAAEQSALCVFAGDGDLGAGELIQRPGDAEFGVVPEDAAFARRVVSAGGLVEDFGRLGEDEEAVGEAFGDPEEFELAVIVAGLEVKAGPAAEVGGMAAEIDGDIPDVPGEDADEFPLRMPQLVVEAAEHTASGERLIVLREGVRKAQGDEGVGVEDFGEPASGIAMTLWLQNLYIA